MDDLLWSVFRYDLSRVGFTVGVLEDEFLFRGGDHLAMGGRGEQAAGGNDDIARGEGTDFRHKERRISSRIVAVATGFFKKNEEIFRRRFCHFTHYGNYKQATKSRYS